MGPKKDSDDKGKRKMTRIMVEMKKEIIAKHENGVRAIDLAHQFGLAKSTISTILKNKETIKGADVARGVNVITKQRSQTLEEVEKLLLIWINEKMLAGDSVSEGIICEKARRLYGDLLEKNRGTNADTDIFQASRGWFEKFKRRSGIRHGHGEASSANKKAAEEFVQHFSDYHYVKAAEFLPQQEASKGSSSFRTDSLPVADKEQPASELTKLWGGRFETAVDPLMAQFNDSIHIDKRMWKADIEGSQAYAHALENAGLLTKQEKLLIVGCLQNIKEEWRLRKFILKAGDEDIHTANERRLKELCGDYVGGKLHTGRSRNDQVATDMKMWLREEIGSVQSKLGSLLLTLTCQAKKDLEIIMPGYTHLQRAQPVRFSHWLMSHAWSFHSDMQHLEMLKHRINILPLGSGALAGNPFDIDRDSLAKELNFSDCSQNSMHAVADRDFVAEFLFWASLTAVHFSKLAEDLIIFSTKEFGFVILSDEFSTGSSLMPQKRNPDSLELIRGSAGKIIGNCTGFLTVMKGLPSTYNKDLQGDKEAMFDTADTIQIIIQIANGVISTMKVSQVKCNAALNTEMLATDLAYYLVRKGVAFRNAHEIAGKVVSLAEKRNCNIHELSVENLKSVSNVFEDDVLAIWDYENSVEQYKAIGGTSLESVVKQITKLQSFI